MSLGDVVGSFATGTYTVTRTSAGARTGGIYVPSAPIELDVTAVDPDADALTSAGHGLATGAGPVWATTDDTLPPGVPAATPVWLIAVDADTLQLAASKADALAGTPIDITDIGLGSLHLSSSFVIGASVRQIAGKLLEDLAEGQRAEDSRAVWTRTELKVRSADFDPDVIVIDGDRYRVTAVKYLAVIAKVYRCLVERLEVP